MPKFVTPDGTVFMGSRAEFQRRYNMPYGKWTCPDGREVLFSRQYKPLCERASATSPATPADNGEWVEWEHQSWFYNDGYTEKQKSHDSHLSAHRRASDSGGVINIRAWSDRTILRIARARPPSLSQKLPK